MKVRIKQNNCLNMNRKYSCRFDENDCFSPGVTIFGNERKSYIKKIAQKAKHVML